jgi:hypothetical protein
MARPGEKGLALEELLKSYFSLAGYFAVRSVPYKVDDEDVTDIDLWLYERPGASTRRRMIVDIKNRRSPKAAERIIWTKGLQSALGVDSAIVATTDRRAAVRRLARALGVTLLDGDAIAKLGGSNRLKGDDHLHVDALDSTIKAVDAGRRSSEWRTAFQEARASLITGFGVQSANKNLSANAFFAEQVVVSQPESNSARVAIRLVYFTASLVAISLDFLLADHAFASPDDRRKVLIDALRFGQSETVPAIATVRTAIGLARQYAENGPIVAKQIEHGFHKDADRIPAEIIADHVPKLGAQDSLFNIARELERSAFAKTVPAFDSLSTEAKSFLGVILDFGGISREKFATAWPKGASTAPVTSKNENGAEGEEPKTLFSKPADT